MFDCKRKYLKLKNNFWKKNVLQKIGQNGYLFTFIYTISQSVFKFSLNFSKKNLKKTMNFPFIPIMAVPHPGILYFLMDHYVHCTQASTFFGVFLVVPIKDL